MPTAFDDIYSSLNSGGQSSTNQPEPRGIRNNNPGNLVSAAKFDGQVGDDGRFGAYDSADNGLAAISKNLLNYAKQGYTTPEAIINRWAPPHENDTASYVNDVARSLGVAPDQPLDLSDPQTLAKLTVAIVKKENGKQPYSPEQVSGAVSRALNSSTSQKSSAADATTRAEDPLAARLRTLESSDSGLQNLRMDAGAPAEDPVAAYMRTFGIPESEDPNEIDPRLAKIQESQSHGFVKHIVSGAKDMVTALPALGAAVAGLLGKTAEDIVGSGGYATQLADLGLGYYKAHQAEAKKETQYNVDLSTAMDRVKQGDGQGLVDWMGDALGMFLGATGEQIAATLLGGLVGSTVGPEGTVAGAGAGLVAKSALKKFVAGLADKAIAEETANIVATQTAKLAVKGVPDAVIKQQATAMMADEAVRAAAVKAVGANLGRSAASNVLNVGQTLGMTYGDAAERAEKEGQELSGTDLMKVWAGGVVAGKIHEILASTGVNTLAGKIPMPGATTLGRTAAGAAQGAAAGAAGMTGMTAAVRYGAGKDLTGDEATNAYINAAGMGALPGLGVGAVGGAVAGPRPTGSTAREILDRVMSTPDVDTAISAADDAARHPDVVAQEQAADAHLGMTNQAIDAWKDPNLGLSQESASADQNIADANQKLAAILGPTGQPSNPTTDAALRSIEGRGGIASPEEAAHLDSVMPGQRNYDSVDQTLAIPPRPETQPRPGSDVGTRLADVKADIAEGTSPYAQQFHQDFRDQNKVGYRDGALTDQQILNHAGRYETDRAKTPDQSPPLTPEMQGQHAMKPTEINPQVRLERAAKIAEANKPRDVLADAAKAREEAEAAKPAVSEGGIALRSGEREEGKPIEEKQAELHPDTIDKVAPDSLPKAAGPGQDGMTQRGHKLVAAVARIFNKEVVLYRAADGSREGGFVHSDTPNKIYLNVNSGEAHLAVLGHELTHMMRRESPKAFEALKAVVAKNVDAKGMEDFQKYYNGEAKDHVEELTGDLVGNHFVKPEFWNKVFTQIAHDHESSEARQIISHLGRMLRDTVDRVMKLVGGEGFKSERFVKNMGEISDAVHAAMVEYAKQTRDPTVLGREKVDIAKTPFEKYKEARDAGTTQSPTRSVIGTHYSQSKRDELDSNVYGTGERDAAAKRIADSGDARLKKRTYFYVNEGKGIKPEAGVGYHAHEARLDDLYDTGTDHLGLAGKGGTALEQGVLDNGFKGYYAPKAFGTHGAAVMLGDHKIPVEYKGMGARAPRDDVQASRARKEPKPAKPTVAEDVKNTIGKKAWGAMTPREREKLNRGSSKVVAQLLERFPSAKEGAAIAYAGRAKRGWYHHSAQALLEVFGADAPRFAALLAAMSPQTSVKDNLVNTVRTWRGWVEAGRPTDRDEIYRIMGENVQGNNLTDSVLDAWVNNSVRALSHEDPGKILISGPKVNSFMLNLRDVTHEVTNDAWMAAWAAVPQKLFAGSGFNEAKMDPGKSPGYTAMSTRIRQAAEFLTKKTGEIWTPAEVQETIWSWTKTAFEAGNASKSTRELVKERGITDDMIRSTPDFRTLLHDKDIEPHLRRAGHGEGLDHLRSESDSSGRTFTESATVGKAAPFDENAQLKYELAAAKRLDQRRATGKVISDEEPAPKAKRAAAKKEKPLFEKTNTDTVDAPFSRERNPQIDTPQFKKFFEGSKVTDEQGEPLRVYTGTSKDVDFKSFKAAKNGIWFTPSTEDASSYARENDSKNRRYVPGEWRFEDVNTADRVIPAYLSIKNPKQYDTQRDAIGVVENYKRAQALLFEKLRWEGYDGVIFGKGKDVVYVAFKPEQIKSAIGNNGEFDVRNPRIDRSVERKEPVVNIGLDIPGGGKLSEQEARDALDKYGVKVVSGKVAQSHSESTLIATLDKPLSAADLHSLSVDLKQEAIAQWTGKEGMLEGPEKKNWGDFNPGFFLEPNGKYMTKNDEEAAGATQSRERESEDLGRKFKGLAKDIGDEAFQYPRLKGDKDLSTTLRQTGLPFKVVEEDNQINDQAWIIRGADGKPAYLERKGKDVFIDLSSLESGKSRGSAIYQAVSSWAHANGYIFEGDPKGISPAGMSRRTENMISSAIRHDSTDHLRLHPDQKSGQDIQWGVERTDHNLGEMLRASYNKTVKEVPEIKDITATEHGDFINGKGELVTDPDFAKLAGRDKSGPGTDGLESGKVAAGRAGVSTLKRAAVVGTMLRHASAGDGTELRVGSAALDKALYSRERNPQTDTPEFKGWFKKSKVLDEAGNPLVLYHSSDKDFTEFKPSEWGKAGPGIYTAADPGYAELWGRNDGQRTMPLYVSIQKPMVLRLEDGLAQEVMGQKYPDVFGTHDTLGMDDRSLQKAMRDKGYDGVIITSRGKPFEVVPFDPSQVKSAIGNNGNFDPSNPRIDKSATRHDVRDESGKFTKADEVERSRTREVFGDLNPAQEAAMRAVVGLKQHMTIQQSIDKFKANLGLKIKQGLVDQFAAIKDVSQKAYLLARMSKGTDGTLEATLLYGTPTMNGDLPDVKIGNGGFVDALKPLQGEHQRALLWIAAKRAAELKKLGRENLFTDTDIQSLKTLDQDTLPDGTPRAKAYADFESKLQEYNNAVLKIAKDSGLIDQAALDLYKDQPYVPFYRVAADENTQGPKFSSGLTNQYAWKKLKGGTDQLNSDLLSNVMMNWGHLFDASAKNRAARETMDSAEQLGVAYKLPTATKGSISIMRDGSKEHFQVMDPYLHEAIGAINYVNPEWAKPFATFKHLLTFGATATPVFKIRNLIRDTLTTVGVSDIDANFAKNLAQGWKATAHDSQTRASMLASGGIIRFGTGRDGMSRYAEDMVEKAGGTLLDRKGWQEITGKVRELYDAYAELGDRSENINRAALYEQLIARGKTHAEASFMSRDLLDFTMSGRWPLVRFLVQSVPFLNARIQGLYKMGKFASENPQQAARFAAMAGAVSMASLGLMLAYKDDEDWKKRPDWDRDTYWWFKVGDTSFRIPKPFELGTIGTMAERTWELAVDPEMTGSRYSQRISNAMFQTFSMDPTPQIVKPLVDVYANKDSFTGRQIESTKEQQERPQDRFDNNTSMLARALGQIGLPNPVELAKGQYTGLSPKQIDFLIKGYLGGVGAMSVTAMDYGLRPLSGQGARPDMRLKDVFLAGDFAESLPAQNSRYVDSYYQAAQKITQAYQSYHAAVQRGDVEQATKLAKEVGPLIGAEKAEAKVSKELAAVNTMIRQVDASKSLSGATKRAMLDKLYQQRDKIAEGAKVFATM